MENTLFLLVFLALVAILVFARTRTNNKFEIKVNDVVVALIPIFLFLFIRGDISRFRIGDIEIEKAFKEAYASPINFDMTVLKGVNNTSILEDAELLETSAKGSMAHLNEIRDRDIQALRFNEGYARYDAGVIEEYVRTMQSLQYFVITKKNGDFLALLPVEKLTEAIQSDLYSWDEFKRQLQYESKALNTLPGYLDYRVAVDVTQSRIETMEKFEQSDLKILPVVDNNRFVGIIERDKLSTKLLINISRKLEKE